MSGCMDNQMARQGNREQHFFISFAKRNKKSFPDVEFKENWIQKLRSAAWRFALDCDKCSFDK
jgi:hypothetical protein